MTERDLPSTLLIESDESDATKRALNNAYYMLADLTDGGDSTANAVMHEVLRALAARAVQPGYQLVPIKPTPEMLAILRRNMTPAVFWRELLAIAPAPDGRSVQPQDVVEPGILKLARFGSLMLSKHRNGGYPGGIDGDDAQAAAEASGVIEPRSVAEPCGESCSCAEMMMPEDWPATCYSIPDDVIKARAAMPPLSDVVGSGEET